MSMEKKKRIVFKGERTRSTIIIIIGLLIFVCTIACNFRPGFTLIIAAVSAMATYELVKAAGSESKLLYCVSCAVSALTVAAVGFKIAVPNVQIIYSFYVCALLVLAVIFNKKIHYLHSVMAAFASIAVPYSFSCFIKLNDISDVIPSFTHKEGIFLVLTVFMFSWLTDVFAFLVGRKIGKHKLCPSISPKKSVEGAVSGVLITAALNVVILVVYSAVCKKIGYDNFMGPSPAKYLVIALASCVLSVVSMFGDLAASVLKRNVGIKDYSNILPGHGGIMDRFDSTLFVLPVEYGILMMILPLIN